MKKTLILLSIAAISMLCSSCQKDPVGNTATVSMAGEWVVGVDCIAADGTNLGDLYGVGYDTRIWTYNTAENGSEKMYLSDVENAGDYKFWEYKCLVDIDLQNLTFSATAADDIINGIKVTITNGKITVGGTTNAGGKPNDTIEFDIVYSDDTYAGSYYDHLHVHGFRYTGFAADEP